MPFPSAETTPPVTKMKRVSGRLWGIKSLGSRVYSNGGRRRTQLTPPPAAPRRDAARPSSDASAPSIRHSSATTPSPSSASTVVSAVSVSADFSIRKWLAGQRGDLGQVGDAEHLAAPRRARAAARRPRGRSGRPRRRPPRRTRACATRPRPRPSSARASRATARRPTRHRGSAPPARPGWARAGTRPARRRSGPTSSRGSSTTSNAAPSIASAASSSRTRSASFGAAFFRARRDLLRQPVALGERLGQRGLRPLGLDLGVREPGVLLAAALGVREHRGHAAAVLALEPVVELEPLLDHVEPAGLGLERVGVAAQLRAEVLGLEPQSRQPLGERVQLGVRARAPAPASRSALGEQGRDADPSARRRSARSPPPPRPRRPAGRPARAGARARAASEPFSSSVGSERLDLLDLERQQVQVAVARAGALAQLGERRARARARARAPRRAPRAASRCSRPQKPSSSSSWAEASVSRRCSCWPKNATSRPAERLKVGRRGRAALDERRSSSSR